MLLMRPHTPVDLCGTLNLSEKQLQENIYPLMNETMLCFDNGFLRLLPDGEAYVEQLIANGNAQILAEFESKESQCKYSPKEDDQVKPFYKSIVFWTAIAALAAVTVPFLVVFLSHALS